MSRVLCLFLLALCPLALTRADETPKELPADLKLVPADAGAFVTVRVSDFLATGPGKKLLPTARKLFEREMAEFEKILAVPLGDIERLTAVDLGGQRGLVVRTAKAFDLEKLTSPKAEKRQIGGKTAYSSKAGVTLYPAGDTVFALGDEATLAAMIEAAQAKPDKAHPLAEALALAAGKSHLVVAVRPEALLRHAELARLAGGGKPLSRDELLELVPLPLLPYKPLLRAEWAVLSADAAEGVRAELVARFASEEEAADAEVAALTARYVGRQLAQLAAKGDRDDSDKELKKLFGVAQDGLKGAKAKRDKDRLRVSVSLDAGAETLAGVVHRMQQTATLLQTSNDLKQIALAMHTYHDANEAFAPAAIVDGNGKPLLSWRVAILPYIEQDHVYKQFKLDEPWDSEHNKKLLKQMPAIFAPRLGKTKQEHSTYYRVFTGLDTAFDAKGQKKFSFANIPDGTSNTIMVVEAADAVPWTKPDELEYDARKPLPKLGGQFPGVFLVAMFDGSVRSIKTKIDEASLRAAITASGGEVLSLDP